MKNIIFVITLIFFGVPCLAQGGSGLGRSIAELPKIFISPGLSLHLRAPEPISYVDISPAGIIGDLPLPSLLRIRIDPDSALRFSSGVIGNITVVGETFMAQYQLCLLDPADANKACIELEIVQDHMKPLALARASISTAQIQAHALAVLAHRKPRPIRSVSDNGISMSLGGIYTAGDLLFLDISIKNKSNLSYEIDQLNFEIVDKKINKATNHQSIALPVLYSLYPLNPFSSEFRNIYVLKKATFPAFKQLLISLSETQVSGRTVSLAINYGDVLRADTF